jgi:hypothetical protein
VYLQKNQYLCGVDLLPGERENRKMSQIYNFRSENRRTFAAFLITKITRKWKKD